MFITNGIIFFYNYHVIFQAKPVIKGAEKDEDEEDEEGEDGGEEDDSGGDGAEQKPKRRKRRKKYDFSESSWMARAEEEKRLAQEVNELHYECCPELHHVCYRYHYHYEPAWYQYE